MDELSKMIVALHRCAEEVWGLNDHQRRCVIQALINLLQAAPPTYTPVSVGATAAAAGGVSWPATTTWLTGGK